MKITMMIDSQDGGNDADALPAGPRHCAHIVSFVFPNILKSRPMLICYPKPGE